MRRGEDHGGASRNLIVASRLQTPIALLIASCGPYLEFNPGSTLGSRVIALKPGST
jgi:hypothetical protein